MLGRALNGHEGAAMRIRHVACPCITGTRTSSTPSSSCATWSGKAQTFDIRHSNIEPSVVNDARTKAQRMPRTQLQKPNPLHLEAPRMSDLQLPPTPLPSFRVSRPWCRVVWRKVPNFRISGPFSESCIQPFPLTQSRRHSAVSISRPTLSAGCRRSRPEQAHRGPADRGIASSSDPAACVAGEASAPSPASTREVQNDCRRRAAVFVRAPFAGNRGCRPPASPTRQGDGIMAAGISIPGNSVSLST